MITLTVISSDDAPDRLVAIWAEAERLGIPLRRHAASAPAEDAAGRLADHRAIWNELVQSRARFAAVIPDDVAFDEQLARLLDEEFLGRLMGGGGILRLDGTSEDDGGDLRVTAAEDLNGFEAYIVSRDTAALLLRATRDGADAARGASDRMGAALTSVGRAGNPLLAALPPPVAGERVARVHRGGLIDRSRRAIRRALRPFAPPMPAVPVPRLAHAGGAFESGIPNISA